MIVTGGFNVYSREIEDVIAEAPGVSASPSSACRTTDGARP
jgi:acyl-CoA synthetase (AMP-forming)/AMP-acid ligase II